MSVWKDDGILPRKGDVSSPSSGPDSSVDLTDEQFALVQQRFDALRPRYATLWKELLSQNKENNSSVAANVVADEESFSLEPEETDIACCGGGCSSSRNFVSFLPSTDLGQEQFFSQHEEARIEKGSIGEHEPLTEEESLRDNQFQKAQSTPMPLAPSERTLLPQSNLPVTLPSRETRNDTSGDTATTNFRTSFVNSLDANVSEEEVLLDSSETCRNADGATEDANQESDTDSEDSDASTVLQWDSWSDPKEEHTTTIQQTSLITGKSIVDLPDQKAGNEMLEAAEVDIPSLAEVVLESCIDDDSQISGLQSDEETQRHGDNATGRTEMAFLNDLVPEDSEEEVEWDGSLHETGTSSELSEVADMLREVEIIEVSDSSDEEPSFSKRTNTGVRFKSSKSRQFAKVREDLANRFFREFDKSLCQGRLAEFTTLKWSKTLQKTAGITRLQRTPAGNREAAIELAVKVLDDEERLRSTLLHEVCHAAAYIIDGVSKPAHGECFKKWASRAMNKFPDIEVTTTHDYVIQYSHFWTCEDCGLLYKRHSRSIDVTKHRCGRCKGKLFVSHEDGSVKVARAPSAYQAFVKENSAKVRRAFQKKNPSVSQAEVMKECARLWRERGSVVKK